MEKKKNLCAKFKEIKEGKKKKGRNERREGDRRNFVNKILFLRLRTGKHVVHG